MKRALSTFSLKNRVIFKRFRAVIIGYLVLVIFITLLTAYLGYSGSQLLHDQGFTISFLASFLEDLIFFGLLGIITLYVSVRKPEEEEFELRIRSLANGRRVIKGAQDHLSSEVKKIMTFNESMTIEIKIKSFSKEDNLLSLATKQTKHITNMCRDVKNRLNSKVKIEPGKFVDGIGGEVTYFEVKDIRNPRNNKLYVRDETVKITESIGAYESPDQYLEISEDSTVEWILAYELFGEFSPRESAKIRSNWYDINANRYTKSCKIIISHEAPTDEPIELWLKHRGAKPWYREIRLKKGEVKKFTRSVHFRPNDSISLYFPI